MDPRDTLRHGDPKSIHLIGGNNVFNKSQAQCAQASMQQTRNLTSSNLEDFELNCTHLRDTERSEFISLSPHRLLWPIPIEKELKNTAELLVECLKTEGVRYIFGQFGEDRSLIGRALRKSSIQFIPTRHSRGAASMAYAYSRLTGQPGVCLARSMQNILNFLPGIADANLNHAPLVVITEQVITDSIPIDTRENLNLTNLFAPATQWSYQIDYPTSTPEIVRKAFLQAEAGTNRGLPRAVHLNLPETIAVISSSKSPLEQGMRGNANPAPKMLAQAAKRISWVHTPLILVGSGAIQAQVRDTLIEFATQLEVPVVNTVMAKGIIPETHPLSLGTIASPQNHRHYGIDWADLVITVGCNATECAPQYWNPDGDIPIIHIDNSSAEVNRHYQPNLELVGNLSNLLASLLQQVDRQGKLDTYPLELRALNRAAIRQYANDTYIPFKPKALVHALQAVLNPEDILLSDTGVHREWIIRDYSCEFPNKCLTFHESSPTGLVLSGAIAAKLVHPQHKVLAVTGADGFMGSYLELESAQWLKTPFVSLICNQGGYYPDFVEIAKSMGFKGYRVTASDDLIPILEIALNQEIPIIIDCPMDYSENIC
ncbi:MAG: thiamine pyrophosphate-binding protein [Cyanobacteria bacterium P01_D01_bin.44]